MRPIKEKRERRLGAKLFLKAERCNSPKCVTVRRPYRPGQHGQSRAAQLTDFGRQLQEKQKIQVFYGLNNTQLQKLFSRPKEGIVAALTRRLDQVVYNLGFAKSPRIARQMVSHGHILVNGKKTTVPSYTVAVDDTITIRPESRASKLFEEVHLRLKQQELPVWLSMNADTLTGTCTKSVGESDIQFPFNIDLVGEFYSR